MPGLMDAVAGGETEDALSRLAGFRSQIRGTRPVSADHSRGLKARPLTKDPPRKETSDTRPATRSRTERETPVAPETIVDPTSPPAPRLVAPSASSAIDPAHRAFFTSGAALLAAKCTFQLDAFRAPLPSPSTESLPPDKPHRRFRCAFADRAWPWGRRASDVSRTLVRLKRSRIDLGTRSPHRLQYGRAVLSEKTDSNSGPRAVAAKRRGRTRELYGQDCRPVTPVMRYENFHRYAS